MMLAVSCASHMSPLYSTFNLVWRCMHILVIHSLRVGLETYAERHLAQARRGLSKLQKRVPSGIPCSLLLESDLALKQFDLGYWLYPLVKVVISRSSPELRSGTVGWGKLLNALSKPCLG